MDIPRERLTIRFARAGGPGGQNVNKVSTKVEVRFRLAGADWIPPRVRERLARLEKRRLNREGEFVVVSCRFRERQRNLEDCLEKLARLLEQAAFEPAPRIGTRPTRASRRRRLEEKRRRGRVKRERQRSREGGGDE